MTRGAPYRPDDRFLLRVPALPTELITGILGAARGESWQESYAERVLHAWNLPVVAAAVRLAAPDLATAVDAVAERPAHDRRRVVRSLGRYVNRMSTRSTPLALMAGVSGGVFVDNGSTTLADQALGSVVARADLGWVMHEVKKSADVPDILVRRNDLLLEARGRVWLHTADVYGDRASHAVSVQISPVVTAVLDHARVPCSVADLRDHLAGIAPSATPERLTGFVRRLLDLGMLIVAQRPPLMPAPGADRLRAVRPGAGSDAAAVLIESFTGAPLAVADLDAAVHAVARASAPDYGGHVLQIDAGLATIGPAQLPPEVQSLVSDAAAVMARVVATEPYPAGLRAYSDAFTDHYGAGAEIPVLEVVSAEAGIGPPETYLHPPRTTPGRQAPEPATPDPRVRLAARALARRTLEIELDDETIDEFLVRPHDDTDDRPLAPVMDVTMQLVAPGDTDPQWRGIVRSTALGGRIAARFDDVLDAATSAALRRLAAIESVNLDGALPVELTYLPADAHAANVAIRPVLHDRELPINVAPGVPDDSVVTLDDVRLGVRDGRFYLRSHRLGRELHINQHTALNPMRAPNVCRLLIEVSEARYRRIGRVEWGDLRDTTPFTPRLVRRAVVVARARWLLWPTDVDPDDPGSFATGLRAWARTWMVPRWTYLTDADHHILIDLESDASLDELRRELINGNDPLSLDEALPIPGTGPVADTAGRRYESEIVVPVVRADCVLPEQTLPPDQTLSPGPVLPSAAVPVPRTTGTVERLARPGGRWVYVRLFTEPDAMDGLITTDLAAMIERSNDRVDAPFFVRYSDPAPHLRVRFPTAEGADPHTALADVVEWAGALCTQGRIADFDITTYHREIERYGGPRLIGPAELVFGADSLAVSHLLRHLSTTVLSRPALAALSVEALAAPLVPSLEARRELAHGSAAGRSGGEAYRAAATTIWTAFTGSGADAEALATTTGMRTPSLDAFLHELDDAERDGELYSDRDAIVHSVLHLHCNRMGLDRRDEQTAYGIWRRLLDRAAHDRTGSAAQRRRDQQ